MTKQFEVQQNESETIEFPPIAMALLLDEWRRATMEGQGGWFIRLPRERYDGHGNLWTVVRRAVGSDERIVVACEMRQFQSFSASNELTKAEAEFGHKTKLVRQIKADIEKFQNAVAEPVNTLKIAQLNETLEALEEDLLEVHVRMESLKKDANAKELREWDFPLDLRGFGLAILQDSAEAEKPASVDCLVSWRAVVR